MSETLFYMPGRVVSGPDVLSELARVAELGNRPLLVTGKNFARRSGLLDSARKILTEAGTDPVVFDKVEPEPAVPTVHAAAEFAEAHNCDVVVALGGGSAMDAAKGVAVLLRNPPPLDNYFGEEKLRTPAAPVICVPTTAGTASEVTRYAVIIDPQTQAKKTVASESIIPRLALLAPELTVSLSADLTAETGMDAFSHALESYLSLAGNSMSYALSLQSLRMIIDTLPPVVADLKNLQLREQMLIASTVAGLALNSAGTIINHGMAYTLTLRYGMGHGRANALLLPYTTAYIAEDYPEKIQHLCRILDCQDVEVGLLDLNKRIGIPISLSEAGVAAEDLPALADACRQNCVRALPRIKRQMTVADYSEILRRAL